MLTANITGAVKYIFTKVLRFIQKKYVFLVELLVRMTLFTDQESCKLLFVAVQLRWATNLVAIQFAETYSM